MIAPNKFKEKNKVKDKKQPSTLSDDPLLEALLQGERRALAQAVTLSESQRADQQARARGLLRALQCRTRREPRLPTRRIGITGAPGAGKSTLIAALCRRLLQRQEGSLAVLASDPSAISGGGAVLADKTRMGAIVSEQRVFIRPSPAGVQRTLTTGLLESLLLCEACGFQTLLVESVGTGQADSDIDDYVDCLLLLLAPGSGDGLQGMKRGLIERVDILVVTKADGTLATQAQKTLEDYRNAVRGFAFDKEARTTQYLLASSQDSTQVEALCAKLDAFFLEHSEQVLQRHRTQQRKNLFIRAFAEAAVDHALKRVETPRLLNNFQEMLKKLEDTDNGGESNISLPAELAAEWFASRNAKGKSR